MSFVFDRISDAAVLEGEDLSSAAYANFPYYLSASGRFIGGSDLLDTSWVADTTYPPQRRWKANLSTEEYLDVLGDTRTGFKARAIDDEGSMWGRPALSASRCLVEVPVSTGVPVIRFEWAAAESGDTQAERVWCYTMPDTSIYLVVMVTDPLEGSNLTYYTVAKGEEELTAQVSGNWAPSTSFQDDNGDIWIVGIEPGPDPDPQDTMVLTRLTDVTGSSAYPTPQAFTIPEVTGLPIYPVGLCADSAFIGAFHLGSDGFSDTLFRAELDGSLTITTLDVSANPVVEGLPTVDFAMQNAPNPTRIFIQRENDDSRIITEMNTDLTFGTSYDLDDWNAGDHATESAPETVEWPIYIDSRDAFAGTRYFFTDDPTNDHQQGDLFIYYLGPGLTDDDVALRVWGYSLDGHDYYVLRVGGSETLTFDLTTNTWAHWASPEVETWRAHVGQNWAGMSTATLALNFGSDVVAGDDTAGQLWILDPTAGMDDDPTTGTPTAFDRKVTGEISMSGRNVLAVGAVTLDLSIGNPTETGSTITLRTSDDAAHNWATHDVITVTAANYSAVVEWRGLGQIKAPGRIFEFVDNGAAVRISAANLR